MVDIAGSVPPLKGLKSEKEISELFIRQSTRSNYCAVYSTGILLAIRGVLVNRDRALEFFKLKRTNPDYSGASHFDIGSVFAREAGVTKWRWKYYDRFAFASVCKSLRGQFRKTGCPTLLTFGIIHKNGKWKAKHVAVVVGATGELIELIDPLGAQPKEHGGPNITFCQTLQSKSIRVIGNSYRVNVREQTAILLWDENNRREG